MHTVVSKRAVRRDVDVLGLAVRNQVILGEVRVCLDLVRDLGWGKQICGVACALTRLTGTTPVALMIPSICSMLKLDTPIALT